MDDRALARHRRRLVDGILNGRPIAADATSNTVRCMETASAEG